MSPPSPRIPPTPPTPPNPPSGSSPKSPWDVLTGRTDRDRRNVQVLLESVTELYSAPPQELSHRAVDRAILVADAQRGILLLDEGEGPRPAVARDRARRDLPLDLRYSRSVVDRVWRSGAPLYTVDAPEVKAAALGQSVLDLRLLSIMAVPLLVEGRRLGILYVDSTAQARAFDEADLVVFQALSGLIAVAVERERKDRMERQLLAGRVENERMERQLLAERLEKERMEHQISLAHDVQRRLLPSDLTAPSGFDLAGEARACEALSGDYFDAIRLADGKVALVVGDVSGHGIGPALFMASARALIQALLGEGADPLKVLRTVNNFLARDMPDNAFMSLFLGLLDPVAKVLVYGSAGHNPPLLVRASGGIEELGKTGPVLAVLEDVPYRISGGLALSSGDALALYTDGIFEAHRADGEMYGETRFRDSLEGHVRAGALRPGDRAGRPPGSRDLRGRAPLRGRRDLSGPLRGVRRPRGARRPARGGARAPAGAGRRPSGTGGPAAILPPMDRPALPRLLGLALLALVASCGEVAAPDPVRPAAGGSAAEEADPPSGGPAPVRDAWIRESPTISLLLAGNQRGRLTPVEGPKPSLGGLERLATLVDLGRARAPGGFAAVSLGWTLADTAEAQAETKAALYRKALEAMGFDAFLLGTTDLGVPALAWPYPDGRPWDRPAPPANAPVARSGPLGGAADTDPLATFEVKGLTVRVLGILDPEQGARLGGVVETVLPPGGALQLLTPRPDALWIVATDATADTIEGLREAMARLGPAVIVDLAGAGGARAASASPSPTARSWCRSPRSDAKQASSISNPWGLRGQDGGSRGTSCRSRRRWRCCRAACGSG